MPTTGYSTTLAATASNSNTTTPNSPVPQTNSGNTNTNNSANTSTDTTEQNTAPYTKDVVIKFDPHAADDSFGGVTPVGFGKYGVWWVGYHVRKATAQCDNSTDVVTKVDVDCKIDTNQVRLLDSDAQLSYSNNKNAVLIDCSQIGCDGSCNGDRAGVLTGYESKAVVHATVTCSPQAN
jgi:hypothetical protein